MNRKIINIIFPVILIFASSVYLYPETDALLKGNITVEITNLEGSDGDVMAGLYNSSKGFPENSESMIMRVKASVTDNKCKVEFRNVPYGVYAVSGYYDQNKNGKLDKGMFNIPKEGLITSNNASGKMGPAKFNDAKFELNMPEIRIEIKTKYY